ncbi:MAG TPA: thioredoxin-dependent thiol peroxidase [Candidatus Poseidoniales archaeon]|nr:MAG TPA: thioredoxin-dependent thiol peroxidase [Candidatus Poseidoniales archaeon]HIH82262.1 thioredoxin-dependent thiol peroxidase [Candidatus Thalassarchaeaceae archaeon]|tara:strand:- start:1314 stop:1796 length:483 start_codon:yes stop_codon:yes gene_type:complete
MGNVVTLEDGMEAPLFSAEDSAGNVWKLSDLLAQGKRVVLYFYPKDSTPGCTKQACDFRDNMGVLSSANVAVFGVSKDSAKSHQNFTEKQELNFPLLLDTEGELLEKYGVWREKQNYGRTYMGIARSTFVIESDGTLSMAKYGVKATGHVARIMKHLELE